MSVVCDRSTSRANPSSRFGFPVGTRNLMLEKGGGAIIEVEWFWYNLRYNYIKLSISPCVYNKNVSVRNLQQWKQWKLINKH